MGNISNEAPVLSISRVLRLTSIDSLEEVSCLMMSDTGLYLNWIPNTLNSDDDEDEFEPTLGGNTLVGKSSNGISG